MSDAKYSLVVAMLTAGGLIGALSASYVSDRFGRRLSLFGTALLMGLGSVIMTFAFNVATLMAGRFVAGLGSGIVTVVVPAYIAECVPKGSRGFFGTLNQLAIVVGILVAQGIGMAWSTLAAWRSILAIGVVLSIAQLLLLPFCVDSPRHLASIPGGLNSAKASLLRLRGPPIELVEAEVNEWRNEQMGTATGTGGHHPYGDEEEHGEDNEGGIDQEQQQHLVATAESERPKVNVIRLLSMPQYRRPLSIVLLLQLTQQFSGINAVIFYSTSIMSAVFPQSSDLITVYISVVNLAMTIVSAYLMDRVGRRTLFLASSSMMSVMSILLGWSIEAAGQDKVSAAAIIGFVAAFAIGLGPIPFLMIPELVDTPAVSSAGSVGLACNMVSNFVVSAGFLGLRDIIGQDGVFYLFGGILVVMTGLAWCILPETKGRSADEVIRSNWAVRPPQHYQPVRSTSSNNVVVAADA
ncbi:major facilitator superfamily domain-containing protein [Zychaea mexicana]|uniref:major facilitator superfamily domain-containing protein n=1 Tax=Zychaea mexicana TaxID=64656 RepID=UPI0022FE069B|nr:major facilitator superfamily domain-containing protein [Zychaea mexicana]KAI9493677.1 major facilitator superfamily domain-containing protein [Zychaea mexicana]